MNILGESQSRNISEITHHEKRSVISLEKHNSLEEVMSLYQNIWLISELGQNVNNFLVTLNLFLMKWLVSVVDNH